MSKKPSGKSAKTQSKATEKARRDAVAEIQQRIDAPQPLTDAERAGAQQVASIDVDPKVELAAAAKHAARGKKGGKVKAEPPTKPAKQPKEKRAKAAKEPKPKRLSALDAAAQVIAKSDKPMTSDAMIEQMEAKGLWKSPGGKTPGATLYAAVIREIAAKGKDARFRKVDRGLFIANA